MGDIFRPATTLVNRENAQEKGKKQKTIAQVGKNG